MGSEMCIRDSHSTKEFFVSTANKPLVGTLMTTGDVTVSIAIGKQIVFTRLTRNLIRYQEMFAKKIE